MKHYCDDGDCTSALWIANRIKIKVWRNEWPRKFEIRHLPPLNPDDPPCDRSIFLALAFGVTLRIDYCPTGRFCLIGWCEGHHPPPDLPETGRFIWHIRNVRHRQ